MSKIVVIDGRDAIPIQDIPDVTGGTIDPWSVANYLAHSDGPPFQFFHDVFAFHVNEGRVTLIRAREWDALRDRFAALEATLRAESPNKKIGRDRWNAESKNELPADVYVWRDDFERAWRQMFPILAPNERSDDRDLNYAAKPLTASTITRGGTAVSISKGAPEEVGAGDTASEEEDNDDRAGHTNTRPDEPPPVAAEVVMEAFPSIKWGDQLSKVSETKYQWLNPALRYKGRPRPGDAKRFSLAQVAVCLVLGPKKFPRNTANAIIKKHPEWLPEWERLSEYLPNN